VLLALQLGKQALVVSAITAVQLHIDMYLAGWCFSARKLVFHTWLKIYMFWWY